MTIPTTLVHRAMGFFFAVALATLACTAPPAAAQVVQDASIAQIVQGAQVVQVLQVAQAMPATNEPGAGQPARKAQPRPAAKPKPAKPVPVPAACTDTIGVERRICIECDSVPIYKRIGCQQRVFWSECKGKRLLTDAYCQTHEDRGPPRGEGN
jgi:hypothetical protein